MRNEFLAAVVCICATVIAVKRFESADVKQPAGAEAAVLTPASGSNAEYQAYVSEIRVPASANHQYFVTAAVNSRPASFLIDTGASFVALRDSDARAANIHTSWSDYSHPVRTANGETRAALINIDMIEIDGIRIRGVKAFILPDDQLSVNLLGMSFLSRLESVEARGGELVLKG